MASSFCLLCLCTHFPHPVPPTLPSRDPAHCSGWPSVSLPPLPCPAGHSASHSVLSSPFLPREPLFKARTPSCPVPPVTSPTPRHIYAPVLVTQHPVPCSLVAFENGVPPGEVRASFGKRPALYGDLFSNSATYLGGLAPSFELDYTLPLQAVLRRADAGFQAW